MAFHWEEGLEYARYIDENRQNIEVMHVVDNPENPHGREAKLHVLPADENDAQFQALLEKFSYDEIMEMTYVYNKNAEKAFEQQVLAIAQKQSLIALEDFGITSDAFVSRFVEVFFGQGIDPKDEKEILFKAKLQLFELDNIRSSNDRALKSKLRKAKSLKELFTIAFEFDQAQEESTS